MKLSWKGVRNDKAKILEWFWKTIRIEKLKIKNKKLKIKLLPNEWFIRWVAGTSPLSEYQTEKDFMIKMTEKYTEKTGNDYAYLGQEFHSDIKFVHFTHSSNKPHEWIDYEIFK